MNYININIYMKVYTVCVCVCVCVIHDKYTHMLCKQTFILDGINCDQVCIKLSC